MLRQECLHALPNDTTTYGSWYDTGTPTYGTLTASGAPYCYESSGSASGGSTGSVTTKTVTKSRSSAADPSGTFYYLETTKTNYEYRTYTRYVYHTVSPAPVAGSNGIRSTAVKSAILTISTSSSSSAAYTLYLSTSADGQSGRTVIGTKSGTSSLAFSLADQIGTLYTSQRYLVLERAGSSSTAITVTGAALALNYYSGAKRTEEYVWNGASWVLLSVSPDEYMFSDTTDVALASGAALFNFTFSTAGQEGDRFEFELLGIAGADESDFFLYVNGNTTNSAYTKQYVYGSSNYVNGPLVGYSAGSSYRSFTRGTISIFGGTTFISGINQRGQSSHTTAYFAITFPASALASLSVQTNGPASAGCKLRVKRA